MNLKWCWYICCLCFFFTYGSRTKKRYKLNIFLPLLLPVLYAVITSLYPLSPVLSPALLLSPSHPGAAGHLHGNCRCGESGVWRVHPACDSENPAHTQFLLFFSFQWLLPILREQWACFIILICWCCFLFFSFSDLQEIKNHLWDVCFFNLYFIVFLLAVASVMTYSCELCKSLVSWLLSDPPHSYTVISQAQVQMKCVGCKCLCRHVLLISRHERRVYAD